MVFRTFISHSQHAFTLLPSRAVPVSRRQCRVFHVEQPIVLFSQISHMLSRGQQRDRLSHSRRIFRTRPDLLRQARDREREGGDGGRKFLAYLSSPPTLVTRHLPTICPFSCHHQWDFSVSHRWFLEKGANGRPLLASRQNKFSVPLIIIVCLRIGCVLHAIRDTLSRFSPSPSLSYTV